MFLYLVQHGKALPKEVDPDRSLTEEGISETKRIANYIKKYADKLPQRIIHSGKRRARQTAEIFEEILKPSEGIEQGKELEPESLPWGWVEKLKEYEGCIMIVGHLPHLKRLASLLLCHDENKPIIQFYNSGAVFMSRDESGLWSLHWIVIPEIVPE